MQIIGTTTTYHEQPSTPASGRRAQGGSSGLRSNTPGPNYDPDADGAYLTDDQDIARAGGVTADDRVEVQPWIEKEGRFSFASSDPRAIDLACFADLAR